MRYDVKCLKCGNIFEIKTDRVIYTDENFIGDKDICDKCGGIIFKRIYSDPNNTVIIKNGTPKYYPKGDK